MNKKIIYTTILVTLIYALSPKILLAKSVECYTQFGPCPEQIVSRLQSLSGVPLLRPLPVKTVQESLSSYPQIKNISLFRRLPQTLVVGLDLHRPIGQVLGLSTPEDYGLVGTDGTIYSHSPQFQNLPLLELDPDTPPTTTKLSPIQTQALVALEQISRLTTSPPKGTLNNTELHAFLDSGLQIVLNVDDSRDHWYPPLQLILDRSKMSSKYPKKIDLRFNHPVLTY